METKPYTYLLKHLPTGKYYYGCRYARGCNPSEFWVNYKTSSTHVKKLIEEYGEDTFQFQIRKVFDDVEQCRNWETRVLKRIGAVKREDFINKTDNISISTEAAIRGIKNRIASEKQRDAAAKMGKANRGKVYPDEINKKKAHPGNKFSLGRIESQETRLKKSKSKLGKPSNAVGNYQPKCSCVCCKKVLTSGTIGRHVSFHHPV
jgi:hypothetical protein